MCKEYGMNARIWMRKFAGLLPEVYRRKLYKRKGFGSIQEFAKKLAGMSEESVDKILRMSEKLKDKPNLLRQLETGTESWNKIEKVAYIATPETDQYWAQKVSELTQSTLEMVVQDCRKTASEITLESENQLQKWNQISFPLSPEVEIQMRQIKHDLEKEKGEAAMWNDVLQFLLNQKAVQKSRPQRTVQLCPSCIEKNIPEDCGRYIPSGVRNLVLARCGTKCVYPECRNPYEHFHHTKRYSLARNHDPDFIVPLCKNHHHLLHTGLVENEEKDPSIWMIRKGPDFHSQKYRIDMKVRSYSQIGTLL